MSEPTTTTNSSKDANRTGGDAQDKKSRNNTRRTNRVQRFKGRCEDLGQHVYDRLGSKQQQAKSYVKTTEEIANYVGKEYTQGYYIRLSIEEMQLYDINALGDNPTELEREIWKEEIKEFVKLKRTFSTHRKQLYSQRQIQHLNHQQLHFARLIYQHLIV